MTTETTTKKTRWSFELALANVVFPDGAKQEYDTDLVNDTDTRNFLFHYGVKQFLSDKIAGIGKGATSAMKLAVFDEYFKLLTEGVTKKAVVHTPKMTEAEFMAQAKADGVPEDMAAKMWAILNPTK